MSKQQQDRVVWLPPPDNEYQAEWLEENYVFNYYSSSIQEESVDTTEAELFPDEKRVVSFIQETSVSVRFVLCFVQVMIPVVTFRYWMW